MRVISKAEFIDMVIADFEKEGKQITGAAITRAVTEALGQTNPVDLEEYQTTLRHEVAPRLRRWRQPVTQEQQNSRVCIVCGGKISLRHRKEIIEAYGEFEGRCYRDQSTVEAYTDENGYVDFSELREDAENILKRLKEDG
jgi:hypothetical protein